MPFHSRSKRKSEGFTLVEIMIVVLIIGILLAIAIPNFVQAREVSRAKSCIANLNQINSAKLQCTLDNRLGATATATLSVDGATASGPGQAGTYQLVTIGNTADFVRRTPSCPSGGHYALGTVNVSPACDVTGAVGTGYAPGEKWWHGY